MVVNVRQEVLQFNTFLASQVVGNVWYNTLDFPRTPIGCPQIFQFQIPSLSPWFPISSHSAYDSHVQDPLD